MNKARRKEIEKLRVQLEGIRDALDDLRAEEQDYYDNMPEGIQNSEKGEKAQEALEMLQSAVYSLEDVFPIWKKQYPNRKGESKMPVTEYCNKCRLTTSPSKANPEGQKLFQGNSYLSTGVCFLKFHTPTSESNAINLVRRNGFSTLCGNNPYRAACRKALIRDIS